MIPPPHPPQHVICPISLDSVPLHSNENRQNCFICIIYSFKFPWISTIFSCVRRKSSFNLLWNDRLTFCVSHNLWPPQIKTASSSHWQESRSRKISRRNDSIFSRSLEKIGFLFLFLFLIFKIFRNLFYFLFSIYEIF